MRRAVRSALTRGMAIRPNTGIGALLVSVARAAEIQQDGHHRQARAHEDEPLTFRGRPARPRFSRETDGALIPWSAQMLTV
ncbi:hypothetical protein BU14_0260s0019 [Porphyra umbilicalis]|uniref:Uncharacterized protein n=1 Tax=Porphyra umbilicalis TaxID=2786 RepID=A0A1X6P2G9_PORUM|nr:hypothetical protein BU14_0260s0019 [Porphyra umbilicalis]|eukprot:OSX74950.1 hypothetical protein BU14_0260s0019 [Porphyra umbilicalis]